jgi:hypothetical protein
LKTKEEKIKSLLGQENQHRKKLLSQQKIKKNLHQTLNHSNNRLNQKFQLKKKKSLK